MQHHGTLKRLISLAAVLSVLRVTKIAASIESSVKEMPFSHFTNNIVELHLEKNPSKSRDDVIEETTEHLKKSKVKFYVLLYQIHASVQEGAYIHVEDCEGDDWMQNLLASTRNVPPEQVYLVGGNYNLRFHVSHGMWNYITNKFKIKKPKIHTISAKTEATFDSAEGAGLFDEATKIKIMNEATQEEYENWVNEAKERLKETLTRNKFTTIALKTVPAGLIDVLQEVPLFQNGEPKLAIIWTGPLRKKRWGRENEMKHNYILDSDASDALILLKIPIIIVSTTLDNTRMTEIIDKSYMADFRIFQPAVSGFDEFEGFNLQALTSTKLKKDTLMSYYLSYLADDFREKILEKDLESLSLHNQRIIDLENDNTLPAEEKEKKIINLKNYVQSNLALAQRWDFFKQKNTEDKIFREFCPMDQVVELITDPDLKNSVHEVIEVSLTPIYERKEPKEGILETEPSRKKGILETELAPNTNIFIVTKFDSKLLEDKNQYVIDWMAKGEPELPSGNS